LNSKEKAMLIAAAAAEKKGVDIRVLDLREIGAFTDFFVIATGTSDRHVRTVADSAVDALRAHGERPLGVEGEDRARWVLVDAGDVVLHVFQGEVREFYDLERLWGEAETVDLLAAGGAR
jgi:ribosome-associated protein